MRFSSPWVWKWKETVSLPQIYFDITWNGSWENKQWTVLTLGETRRVVIDIRQGDIYKRRPRQASHLSPHVFGLDHHLILLPVFSVHFWQRSFDDTCNKRNNHFVMENCILAAQTWQREEALGFRGFINIYCNQSHLLRDVYLQLV